MAFASITYTSANGTTFALTNSDGNAIEYLRQNDISVTVNGTLQTVTTDYTFNAAGTSIVLNSAVTNATVVLSRTTDIADATVNFTPGSTLTAADLNNSDKQNRFSLQEFSDSFGGLSSGTGDLSALAGFIGGSETWTSDDAHAATTAGIDARIDTALTTDISGGDGVTITTDTPGAGQVRVDLDADIATLRNMQAGAATTLAALTSTELGILDGATVTTAELNTLDGVTATAAEINLLDGVTATTGELNVLDGVTASTAELNILDGVTATATELNTLDGITATTAELNFVDGVTSNVQNQIDGKQPLDAELTELATMSSGTASALADLTQAEVQVLDGATLSTAELNQLDGNSLTNSPTWTSTTDYPSASAVNTRFVGLMDAIGGFVAIADDQSFPTTNPDPSDNAGTVVSISDAGGLVIDGSGESTTGRTTGADVVTITGFPANLQSTTLSAGLGLQVQTTTTLNTYTYHKLIAKESDVIQLSQDIEDFGNRYRVSTTNPTTDNDEGDLVYNTTDDVLRVFDGTNWVTAAAANASQVAFSAGGDLAATDVQAAIDELDDEKVPRTSTTGAAVVPAGTEAQRPTGVAGHLRFNSDTASFEGYNGTDWGNIGGGASAGGAIYENSNSIDEDYTLTANTNGMSVSPLTIASGVTVTIPSGAAWVIL